MPFLFFHFLFAWRGLVCLSFEGNKSSMRPLAIGPWRSAEDRKEEYTVLDTITIVRRTPILKLSQLFQLPPGGHLTP